MECGAKEGKIKRVKPKIVAFTKYKWNGLVIQDTEWYDLGGYNLGIQKKISGWEINLA